MGKIKVGRSEARAKHNHRSGSSQRNGRADDEHSIDTIPLLKRLGTMERINGHHRPSKLQSYVLVVATYFIAEACLIASQELEVIQVVISKTMDQLCFTPCENGFTGIEVIPGTKCAWYHRCNDGEPTDIVGCGGSLWYNPTGGFCDIKTPGKPIDCPPDPSCPPTFSPTDSSTYYPTSSPEQKNPDTEKPTMNKNPFLPGPVPDPPAQNNPSAQNNPPTNHPTYGSTAPELSPSGPIVTEYSTNNPPDASATIAMDYIKSKKNLIQERVLVSYNRASGLAYPSTQYTINGLIQSLQVMGVDGFGADFQFMLWEGMGDKWVRGLVNLAAFLANCMVESIEDDTCDELNWQKFEGKYPISNSCGQDGRSYQDENCVLGTTEFMSCDVDKNMQVTAVSSGSQVRAPPPMKCGPGTNYAGYWDFSSGREVAGAEYVNVAGRTDIKGCCWWGRGALLTRGVCNIGKINYFLGKRGAELGRTSLYPDLDFCRYPEVACTSAKGDSIRWTMAFFEWAERVQRYQANGWNFENQISQFISGDMTSDSFVIGISRILSRGCHETGCSDSGEVRLLNRRKQYFFMIINDVFDLKSVLATPKPTAKPTQPLTRQPTRPIMQPVVVISPPAGLLDGMPAPQQEPNPVPMENQNMDPAMPPTQQQSYPIQIDDQNMNPTPMAQQPNPTQIEQQNTNSSPVAQSDQSAPMNGVPASPVAQPAQPASAPFTIAQPGLPVYDNGALDEETSYPTYGSGELIAIEGNAVGMVSPKQIHWLLLLSVELYVYFFV